MRHCYDLGMALAPSKKDSMFIDELEVFGDGGFNVQPMETSSIASSLNASVSQGAICGISFSVNPMTMQGKIERALPRHGLSIKDAVA